MVSGTLSGTGAHRFPCVELGTSGVDASSTAVSTTLASNKPSMTVPTCKCSHAVEGVVHVVPRRLAGVQGVVRASQGVIARVSRIPENSAARPRRDDGKRYHLRDEIG